MEVRGAIMLCPKCGGSMQRGQAVVEQSPGEWVTVGLFLLAGVITGGSSSTWYFEPSEGGERVPLLDDADLTVAYRCPKCKTVVMTLQDPVQDPTREEMVTRWHRLTSESPRQ
jgi:hypothetical protein